MFKLNGDKIEVMLFSSRYNSKSMDAISVNEGNSLIASTLRERNLDVMFDSIMTREQRVNAVCRSGYGQLRKIGCISRHLPNEATKSLVNGPVTSRLNYGNVLMTIRTSPRNHITPVPKELHRLPIRYRIQHKTFVE
jgi:hypothetical protein